MIVFCLLPFSARRLRRAASRLHHGATLSCMALGRRLCMQLIALARQARCYKRGGTRCHRPRAQCARLLSERSGEQSARDLLHCADLNAHAKQLAAASITCMYWDAWTY